MLFKVRKKQNFMRILFTTAPPSLSPCHQVVPFPESEVQYVICCNFHVNPLSGFEIKLKQNNIQQYFLQLV